MQIIGELLGALVKLDRVRRQLIVEHEDMPALIVSVDHPYLKGTKLRREAQRLLGEAIDDPL